MRRQILEGESQAETIAEWIEELTAATLDAYAARGAHPEDWDLAGLTEALHRQFDYEGRVGAVRRGGLPRSASTSWRTAAVKARFAEREGELGPDLSTRSSVTRC